MRWVIMGAARRGTVEGPVVRQEMGSGPENLWVAVGTALTLSETGCRRFRALAG